MSLLSLFQWLQNTPVSVAIRESTFAFPIIEGLHVMGTVTAVGTILALDLRLLGWGMKKTPVSAIFEELRMWSLGGFALQMITGVLLFWAEPIKCYTTKSFLVKMVLLALAGANAMVFDRRVYPSVAGWDTAVAVPGAARFAGAASLFLWFGVVFCGRWTAYF
jgi:hypothetical protein